MVATPINATGWNELYKGDLIGAVYHLYDGASYFGGWAVVILFVVFQVMLYLKTRNLNLCWITGLFFASLFALSGFLPSISLQIIFLLLVLEGAGVLYFVLWG